jgi:hypothetical protein
MKLLLSTASIMLLLCLSKSYPYRHLESDEEDYTIGTIKPGLNEGAKKSSEKTYPPVYISINLFSSYPFNIGISIAKSNVKKHHKLYSIIRVTLWRYK